VTRALSSLAALVAAALLAAFVGASAGTPTPRTVAPSAARTEAVVQLAAPPLARADGVADPALRIDAQQRRFTAALRDSIPGASVRWRYRIVANGLAVDLPRRELPRLSRLPGVKHVFADVAYHALAGPDAATIHARDLPGSPLSKAGAGIKIGIIDDGVDQKHAFFDPSGYTMPVGFPKGQTAFTTAKVIVARAFPPPGATWKYASLPFDPQDSGHATHVAGIAAGNANTSANGIRISGIAPRAYIGNYKALTVPTQSGLGLNGNAPEIVAAIEAAVADGMDVINLSLGEPEIEPSRDIVAMALDAAAAAGVVPVDAAGNDFDDFGRGSVGSPGSSAAAITVGATTSTASPSMASFSSAGPTPISLRLKPDVVAPGTSILSSQPAGWGLSSGTSMATPHVSGAAALLLQRHPDWNPAQVKAALTVTARPLAGGDGQVGPTREGAGLVDVAAADAPAIRPTPTAVSFGLVHAETITSRSVAVEDAGGGAGDWAVSVELSGTPAGTEIDVPPTVTVPGPLPLDLVSGTTEGEVSGAVILRRGTLTRRIPLWGRVEIPKLAVAKATVLEKPGVYSGNTRGRPALVDTYRYPEVPADAPVSARLAGPEQVFRVRLTKPVANFGVTIVSRGPNSRVEPRVVRGGDENRLTGYAALPFDQNPYVTDFGSPVPSAGALRPSAGTYYVVFDSPTAAGAGTFRFRFWVDDVAPPAAAIVSRKVRRGDPIRVTVTDAGSGIDVSSIDASLDGRVARAPLVGREIRVATGSLTAGTHRLTVALSDFQETRNNENVARILPNTRVISATVTIVRR
jgi:subtilisin family serine protease